MSVWPVMPDIHQVALELARRGETFAMATVLADSGSTPRKAGTKAVIEAVGAIRGTIGGGPVEAETQRRAVQAIRDGRPTIFDFAMDGMGAEAEGPICGGVMRILIDPAAAGRHDFYARIVEARRQRRSGALLTTIRGTNPCQVAVQWLPRDCILDDLPFPGAAAIREALASGAPRLHRQDVPEAGGPLDALVEPLIPPPLLVVAGGGHVGQALALQAAIVGFDVLVIDDRPEFTDPALYPPSAATRCGEVARELADLPAGDDTCIAIVTRGHRHDREALAACIGKPLAYIGMIGSRRKVALIRKDLLESRIATPEQFGRVYAPIGLDIGAETVPEIAASIVAQLIAVRRKGVAPRMPTE